MLDGIEIDVLKEIRSGLCDGEGDIWEMLDRLETGKCSEEDAKRLHAVACMLGEMYNKMGDFIDRHGSTALKNEECE